jgi:hypothetical protein
MWEFVTNLMVEIVKSINWGEVLTSVIQTILFLLIPIFLELTTGVLRATSNYFDANKENSWAMRLISDVATVMDAQWQVEAKDIRAKWDSGELSREEWDKAKGSLKENFKSKMLERLKLYPASYAKKYEGEIEVHMEAWLAQNKKVEALTKVIKENTKINDAEIIEALPTEVKKAVKPLASNVKKVAVSKKK